MSEQGNLFIQPVKRWADLDYRTQYAVMEGAPDDIVHSFTLAAFFDTKAEAQQWIDEHKANK